MEGDIMSERYQLVEKTGRELDSFKVTIKADSNDADYITEVNHYSQEIFEEYIIDGLIHLRENASGHHELGDYDNPFDLDIPFNGWDGYCHTLEELTVEYIDSDGKVWDVIF
jgi:hypothetical protein